MITLKNAKLGYPENVILNHVNLAIDQGSFVVITGENGGGKTTLLKTIAGLLRPLGGSIQTGDARFGYVAQMDKMENSLPMTALEIVELGVAAQFSIWGKSQSVAMQFLKACHADSFAKKVFWELSGGQRQRVLIARALSVNPNCLLLDEPTAGIDHQTQQSLSRLLQEFHQKKKMTILLITHEPRRFEKIATHVLSVSDGKTKLAAWEEYEHSR